MAAAGSSDPKPVATGYPAAPTSSGYAYPYPQPPPTYYGATPQPPQQPYYYGNNSNSNPYYHNGNNNNPYYASNPSSSTTFLRRFFFAVIAVILAIGIASMIVWLVLRPRLPAIAVSSASISSFNLSSPTSLLSANFEITLSVQNPNKKLSVRYDSPDAAVFLGSALVSETTLPPFAQDKGSSSDITARMSAVSRYIDEGAADLALKDKAKDGVLYVNFRMFSWVKFWDGGWRTRMHSLRVYCDDLKIRFANASAASGLLVEGPKQCLVNL